MDNISKLYRTDSDVIDPVLRKSIDEAFLPTLKNLNAENPKLLVVFSGGNAMGKSALSEKIAQDLHGLVLENDAIKRAIFQCMPGMGLDRSKLNSLTWQYSMDLYRRLPSLTSNGLVVRDGIIDWYFDRILPVFEIAGYTLFVVQYEISKTKAIELIKARGDTPTVTVDRLLLQLDDHHIHQQRFRSKYAADIILHEEHMFDHERVVQELHRRVASMSKSAE